MFRAKLHEAKSDWGIMSGMVPRAHTRMGRFEFHLPERRVLHLPEHSVETQNDTITSGSEVKLSGSSSAVLCHLQTQSLLSLKEQTKSRQ